MTTKHAVIAIAVSIAASFAFGWLSYQDGWWVAPAGVWAMFTAFVGLAAATGITVSLLCEDRSKR